ncbi:MAG: hypothetical protein ACUVSM_11520 [Armatimonadota bacterium]
MTRTASILLVFAAVAAMITSLALQADAQGWRGGAGRGASNGAAAIGVVPGVQLTPEQERQVAQIRSETMRRVQEIRRNSSLTPEQMAAEIAKVRQEGHERVMNVLTPEQRQQFESRWPGCRLFGGAGWQGAGSGAGLGRGPCGAGLGRGAGMGRGAGRGLGPGAAGLGAGFGMSGLVPGVQLTAEQQERIRQIRQDGAREAAAVMADPNLTAQEKSRRVQEIRAQTHEQVMSVLTPEQRRQFEQRIRAWLDSSRPITP